MISESFIEQWRMCAPWQTMAMIEQDLVLSRALVNLYNQPKIIQSLAFRGGTALNKLYLDRAARYSEDIDVVQINPEPIGDTIKAIRASLDDWLGSPKSKLTQRSAKLVYRYQAIDDTLARLKIEINTTEHFHIQPLKTIPYAVNSEWFSGRADIVTYHLNELMASKLCALHQRSKGRDLFDLWLVKSQGLIDLEQLLSLFEQYCRYAQHHITRAMFELSLSQKCQFKDFITDTTKLLTPDTDWDFEEALTMVRREIISHLPGKPWKGIKQVAS
ncbi:MAG: nucleotidyl transferase AbiEii/AbiGii toxin family protein [Pseudomonadota bacterium]